MQFGPEYVVPLYGVEETEEDDSVDRNLTGTTSFFKTTFNSLNSLAGIGIMSISYALSSGGWLSLILMLVIASVAFYTGLLIKRCMEVDPNIKSYSDIGNRAFGTKGRTLISILVNLELYLIATSFLIQAGDNLHKLLPNIETIIPIGGRQSLVLLVALVVLPSTWIDKMSTLSYVSATGVVASVIILGCVLWSGIFDGIGFHQKGVLINWSGLPTACSLYTICYHAHAVFPTLYTSMRNQEQFSSVLSVSFLLATVTYVSLAVIGYLMFGSEVQSQITLNLPANSFSTKIAIFTALINPIARYALLLKPAVDEIESRFDSLITTRFHRLSLRTALVGTSVVVALTLPFFGYLVSLVGAFFSVTGSILLPCLCYLKIYRAYRNLSFEVAIIGFIMSMGLVILVFGTYISLLQIIQSL